MKKQLLILSAIFISMTVLEQKNEYQITLITCTPVGTNLKRLIVTAKQISPIPPETEDLETQPKQIIR